MYHLKLVSFLTVLVLVVLADTNNNIFTYLVKYISVKHGASELSHSQGEDTGGRFPDSWSPV